MIDPRELEADIEARFVKVLEAYGWTTRKMEWVGRRGAQDRLCLGPQRQVAFVELKRGTDGVLSANQRAERRMLESRGHTVWIIRNNLDIERFVAEAVLCTT